MKESNLVENKEKIVNVIATFWKAFERVNNTKNKDEVIALPLHLKTFGDYLTEVKNIDSNQLIEAAQKAIVYSNDCTLCSRCVGCANRQYSNIIEAKIDERIVPSPIKPYFENLPQMYYYLSEYSRIKQKKSIENTIICLKGFSSSTPIINSAIGLNVCVGGGFYINYGGKGIVIDPGVDFVKNMHNSGISINDIDTVIVTHSHMDHNSDIEKISSLKYDVNRYYKQCNEMLHILDRKLIERTNITWIVDDIDYKKVSNIEDNVIKLQHFTNEKAINDIDNVIFLTSIETNHMPDSGTSYAIKIRANDICIGYTSDTPYDEKLVTFFHDVDVLIFNISDIYLDDVMGIKIKKNHLGYNGSFNLIRKINPSLAIASEFCCTNGDIRNEIVAQLISDLKNGSFIIPGEIGTTFSIPDLSIKCSICNKFVSKRQIWHSAPINAYGLMRHICTSCLHNGHYERFEMRDKSEL